MQPTTSDDPSLAPHPSPLRAFWVLVVQSFQRHWRDWAMMNYSRWVVLVLYLGFILPLFTLSYASGAFGTDRESRTLVWLMTRPIPRSAIYLGKFVGTLPWCLAFSGGGFVALCLAG